MRSLTAKPTYSGLADSLPRRLQACMQELLSANERHHELLIASRGQDDQLQEAQAEVERLTQLSATAEAAAQRCLDESTREREASRALREAYELQQGRLEAMESEVTRLQAALAASGLRGVAQSTEVAQLQQRVAEANQCAEQAEQRGYSEGMAQQHAQDQGQLRRLQAWTLATRTHPTRHRAPVLAPLHRGPRREPTARPTAGHCGSCARTACDPM